MVVFVLGADDPEMQAIAELLTEGRYDTRFATVNRQRVHAGNAYEADPVPLGIGELLVCIECRPISISRGVELVVIDHHRPGDPGYDKEPREYWEASSIGQLHKLLNIPPSQEARVLAAMDHCFPAALSNECPGITPKEVFECKLGSIAAAHDVTPAYARGCILHFRVLLESKPTVNIGGTRVCDLRPVDLGVGYSLELLCAQVAAALENQPALLRGKNTTGDPDRITLYGADPETTRYFMEQWAPKNGLTSIYGVPDRGYAGGLVAS